MDLKQYRSKLIGSDDERAVSPVIGVILMVAITVILAAVIAAFVLDMGDMGDSAPNAQFEWETTTAASDVDVTLTSGEDINTGSISISGGSYDTGDVDLTASDETWSAGQTVSITSASGEVQLIWESDGTSATLDTYDNS